MRCPPRTPRGSPDPGGPWAAPGAHFAPPKLPWQGELPGFPFSSFSPFPAGSGRARERRCLPGRVWPRLGYKCQGLRLAPLPPCPISFVLPKLSACRCRHGVSPGAGAGRGGRHLPQVLGQRGRQVQAQQSRA